MDLRNKVIVITGGTKGIGLATAQKAMREGAKVVVGARNERLIDEGLLYHTLDVTNSDSCLDFFNYVVSQYGKIDGLVCDAGITRDALTKKMSLEQFNEVVQTNLVGVFNVVKLFGPYMQNQGSGAIVNISSIVGEYGNMGQANYAASKAGLIGMSKSWAKEFSYKGANVRVNVVCPGYIMTDMLKTVPEELIQKFSSLTMLNRLGQPSEVANLIVFLLSDEASYITGSIIDVNGGMRL